MFGIELFGWAVGRARGTGLGFGVMPPDVSVGIHVDGGGEGDFLE